MGYVPAWVYRWVAAALVTLIIGLAWASTRTPEALWAPGHLSRSHAGITRCLRCHEPFQGPTSARCVTCHSPERFRKESRREVGEFHLAAIRKGRPCLTCHTEHLGASARITTRPLRNPHGGFVFRATGARTCTDCHAFPSGPGGPASLLTNELVRELLEEGDGAHRRGAFASCLHCHGDGREDVED